MAKRRRDLENIDGNQSVKKHALSNGEMINTNTKNIENQSESEESNDEDIDSEAEAGLQARGNGFKGNKTIKGLSSQEIQVARETAELFKSNIFKLQIDELIKEARLKDNKIQKIEKFLHKLYDLIQNVPELSKQTINEVDAWFNKKNTVAPFNDPKPNNVNYKFEFKKPENVSIVGSFSLKTGTQFSHGLSIDVNVTMPKELFQAKDYLNYRALHKHSFYLGYLTENLRAIFEKEGFNFLKLSYTYLNGDILTPVLQIKSTSDNLDSEYNFYRTKFAVNVLVGFPFRIFDPKKLLPNKNCIRVQKEESLELPATPLYNASILASTTHDHYLKYLYKAKKSAEQFKECCILGRLWLQQRGLGSNIEKGGFGHFEFAILTAALLNGGGVEGNKILLHGFSSYQLFKGVIKYLATQDLSKGGYLQFYSDGSEATKYVEAGFKTPSIFDKSTKVNILYRVTNASYSLLVHHAKKSLDLLNDVIQDRFESLFLKNSNIAYLNYDYNLEFHLDPHDDSTFGAFEKITYLTYENFIMNKVSKILVYGLGDRIQTISVSFTRNNEFEINKRKPIQPSSLRIKVGLLANDQEAEKLVTRGPLESEDSEEFRSFWGPKSSLRKFKDGTIANSIVWSADYKEPVIFAIISYIFKRHLGKDIKVESNICQFNRLLPLPNIPSSSKQSVISTIAYNNLIKSYDELYRVLIKLKLPLAVKSVFPASPALRSTSYVQPVPFAISSKDFFNDLMLQFETSVKWPDEISALEKVKTAFLLKINEILTKETNYESFITKDEETIPYNFDISTLNVLTPEGFGFRLRILTERDEVLYLRAIENARKEKKSELESVYLKFNQKYLGSVIHTRTISTIAHSFPYYSPTVRLFKKWLDDQLLLSHLREELVELIALQPFVDPAQYDTPSSVENGFLRILYFLSSWNWKEDLLILDLSKNRVEEESEAFYQLSDKLTVQSYQQIKSNFDSLRKQDPQCLKTQLFVASKADNSGILWSNGIPLPIATRLTALSKVAVKLIKSSGLNEGVIDLLFTPALSDYDFVIKLKTLPLNITSGILPSTNTFKNLIKNTNSYPSDITSKFDPILKLARDLNLKFKGTVIFSYRTYTIKENGENVLTGLFVPNTLQKTKFKVQLGFNTKPESKDEVIINKDATFSEILDYAGDLVAGFESK